LRRSSSIIVFSQVREDGSTVGEGKGGGKDKSRTTGGGAGGGGGIEVAMKRTIQSLALNKSK
jgi:hypothetical protein